MHVEKNSEEAKPKKLQQTISPAVSNSLRQLVHTNENVRVQNAVNLVQQLFRKSTDNQDTRERDYVLRRLVRGTGGSNNASKCGFYTALVGVLGAFKNNISLDEIFDVLDKELKVSKKATTKENADAYIGHVLVVTALQKCGMLAGKKNQVVKALEYVVAASQQKAYHYKLSYSCLLGFLASQTEEEFKKTLLPFMRDNLKTSWEEQSVYSLHFLMEAQTRFPALIDEAFLEDFLGTKHILENGNFEKIYELFWAEKPETEIMQPAYDTLGKFAAKSKNFIKFWTFIVAKTTEHPNRAKEVITLKLATDALNSDNLTKGLVKMFSEKFLEMIFRSLRQQTKDEVLKAVYLEFFDALFEVLKKQEDKQMPVLRKLLCHPGTLLIDKYHFSNKILYKTIGVMKEETLKEFANFLRNILIDQEAKNPAESGEKWLNTEKVIAVQIFQRIITTRLLAHETEWKLNQAKFLLNISIFFSNDGENVEKKSDLCVVPIELANHTMNLFYHGLEGSFSTMENGKVILSGLVEHCNAILGKKNPQKYLRREFNEKSLKIWADMYKTVKDLSEAGEKFLVFEVLMLSMGLQLFRDADVAQESLKELQSCVVRAKEKKTQLRSKDDSEPEWIEVLIDLILHLLSQGSSILRNIIKKIFPSLCPQLNLSAIYQILSLLDMKDGQNPLKYENEEDSEESGDEKDVKMNGNQEDSDEESNSEEEEEEDDDEDVEDDEGTVTDKLRSAVSSALGFNGTESDQESVNLDDMSEEEGKRLDEALSAAFKIAHENKPRRKTKKDHREDTTLVHFRNRLIDLLVIYLKHNPELNVTLEIMIALYDMLPYCVDEESKPLLGKIQEALMILVNVRTFRNDGPQAVTTENLSNALAQLFRKNENPQSMEVRNNFVVKGVKFIISSCNKLSLPSESIETTIGDFLTEFINTRNPTLNFTFFSSIFNISWLGLWTLCDKIRENGIATTTRSFRRIQSFDLLTILYKNHRLIKENVEKASKALGQIEKTLGSFLQSIPQTTISLNEFKSLNLLLWEAQRCHKQIPELKAKMQWKEALEKVQEARLGIQLDATAMNSYTKLCSALGGSAVKNSEIQKPQKETNGIVAEDAEMDETEEAVNGVPAGRGKKRKMQQQDQLKVKKNKKHSRLEAAADGLGDGINFAKNVDYSDED